MATCQKCKFWRAHRQGEWGACQKLGAEEGREKIILGYLTIEPITHRDFGCALQEKKS